MSSVITLLLLFDFPRARHHLYKRACGIAGTASLLDTTITLHLRPLLSFIPPLRLSALSTFHTSNYYHLNITQQLIHHVRIHQELLYLHLLCRSRGSLLWYFGRREEAAQLRKRSS
ncbi:hypothetical protein VTL71DRAFT_11872 [Oculimacula yallundae]|uniref:Secreted protein n=1 Tax=Oculimacula yallundae TaxID=86028 RepID=A0ABR4CTX0_9HELO